MESMSNPLRKWFASHWETGKGKAGYGASLFAFLAWTRDIFYWIVDAPGRWHQMSEWANALPLARIHLFPWISPAVFVAGVTLLILDGKRKSPASSQQYPTTPATSLPMPDIRSRIIRAFHDEERYYLEIALVNHTEIPCTVPHYILNVSGGDAILGETKLRGTMKKYAEIGRYQISNPPFIVHPLNLDADHPLRRGIEQVGWVEFYVYSEDRPCPQGETLEENLTLTIVDSLGNKHSTESRIKLENAIFNRGFEGDLNKL